MVFCSLVSTDMKSVLLAHAVPPDLWKRVGRGI
jgi:hypothetical protein